MDLKTKHEQLNEEMRQVTEETGQLEDENRNIVKETENIKADIVLKYERIKEMRLNHERVISEHVQVMEDLQREMESSRAETEKLTIEMVELETQVRQEDAEMKGETDTLTETLHRTKGEVEFCLKESETLDVELKELNKKCDDSSYEIVKLEVKLAQSRTPTKDLSSKVAPWHRRRGSKQSLWDQSSDSGEEIPLDEWLRQRQNRSLKVKLIVLICNTGSLANF